MLAGLIHQIDHPDVRLCDDGQEVPALFRIRRLLISQVPFALSIEGDRFGVETAKQDVGSNRAGHDPRQRRRGAGRRVGGRSYQRDQNRQSNGFHTTRLNMRGLEVTALAL